MLACLLAYSFANLFSATNYLSPCRKVKLCGERGKLYLSSRVSVKILYRVRKAGVLCEEFCVAKVDLLVNV